MNSERDSFQRLNAPLTTLYFTRSQPHAPQPPPTAFLIFLFFLLLSFPLSHPNHHPEPHNYDPLSSSHLTFSLHIFVFPFSLRFFSPSYTHPLHLALPPHLLSLPSISSLSHHHSGKSVRLSGGEEGRVEWEGTVDGGGDSRGWGGGRGGRGVKRKRDEPLT